MTHKAGTFAAGLAAFLFAAQALAQTYSGMAVPGSHNDWNTAPSMVYSAPNWVGTQTVSSASGFFKFAANNAWTTNWGGNASFSRVPASGSAPELGGGNLSYSGLVPGNYRFSFNPSSREFSVEWVGTPLSAHPITNLALVGDFNAWSPSPNAQLTNHPGAAHLWSRSISLDSASAFLFRVNGTNNWGSSAPSDLPLPVSNAYACGASAFSLSAFDPGTFYFLFNASNASFSVVQTSTSDVLVAVSALGSLVATSNPAPNMVKVSSTRWESTHDLTNRGTVTLRFSGNSGARNWGATNASPMALPASGSMATGSSAFASVSGVTNGRYRIAFNPSTGQFEFSRLYTEASGINLIKNPGFETATDGNALHWNGFQSWTKTPDDGVPPHSGYQSGALHAKFNDWDTDYPSYSQDVAVSTGQTYRASAWIRATPEWTAETMQIKMEWRDSANQPLGGDSIVTFTPSTSWQYFFVEGSPSPGAIKAHVVVLCSGAGNAGYMCVDDVEVRQVPPRNQTFDSWGAYASMGAIVAPDGWSASGAKTVYNVPPGRPAAAVFISQYVEGTGNNKAVEIFNGTLSNLDLSAEGYVLQQYNNGSTTPSTNVFLSGVLQPGTCLVVARPGTPTNYAPSDAISGLPILQTNKGVTFNGDDVLVLRRGGPAGTVLDRVGQVGANAVGAIWNLYAKNHTLVRKSTVFTGTVGSVSAPFPADDWTLSPADDFADLGVHSLSFVDPNEPYTPGGYSLVLNTNHTLLSGELSGGVGDVSFWYRTESASPPVDLSIESSSSADGPWKTNGLLSSVAVTNFRYAVFNVGSDSDRYVRFRHVNAGTNRFRLDEISISPYSAIPRLETFAAWTLPSYQFPGTYSRLGWTIQDASISSNGGNRAALLSPPSSFVLSPAYPDGVGEVLFKGIPAASNDVAYLNLQSSVDNGATWTTQTSFRVSASSNNVHWLYLTNNPSQIRIGFDPAYSSAEVLVDDVEVRLPALYRNQNFNSWPTKSSYTAGVASHQGWSLNNCMVDSQEAFDGNSARLGTATDAWIQSPFLPDGIGSISFRMKKSTSINPVLAVEVSSNRSSWTPIATVTSTVSGYTTHSFFYSDSSNRYVRFRHAAGNAIVPVDDVSVSAPRPRPSVSIFPSLSPSAPTVDDSPYLVADVVALDGASIVSVTGVYVVGSTSVTLPLRPVALGSYSSSSPIPSQPAGTMVRYMVRVQYAGIGAAPGSTAFSTNLSTSSTATNYFSSIPKGNVWINEISYFYTAFDDGFWDQTEDHEFVEICGVAGTSVSNWTLQLAFGADADVAKNGGSNVYASYAFTNTFSDSTNGFGFFVFGDSGLLKANGSPVDRTLSTHVPASVDPDAVAYHNHMHNSRGVVRLLDEYKRPVYSLSYNGSVAGSIPTSSQSGTSSNSISLGGAGSTFGSFSWGNSPLSVGSPNGSQILVPPLTNGLAAVFHLPAHFVDSPVVNTNMRAPFHGAHSQPLQILFGYAVSAGYGQPAGVLYYRDDNGPWSSASMTFKEGSQDGDANVYSAGFVPAYTNARGATLQYVIHAQVSKSGIGPTYLGSDGTNGSALFNSLEAAQSSPFLFDYSVPSIAAASYAKATNKWVVYTVGNDPNDPYRTFKVYSATSMFVPLALWQTNSFTTSTDYLGQITFYVPIDTNRPSLFYRFDPTW